MWKFFRENSYTVGFPILWLDMASGLAVIATDVGAVSRLVQGNGRLLPGPVPELIQNAMAEAIALPGPDLNKLKHHSLDLARRQFTWERVIQQKLALLRGLLGERKG